MTCLLHTYGSISNLNSIVKYLNENNQELFNENLLDDTTHSKSG
jgi:hypothetical protein